MQIYVVEEELIDELPKNLIATETQMNDQYSIPSVDSSCLSIVSRIK
jgi:hypothetical protein